MASSPFRTGIALRTAALLLTIGLVAWMIANTQWYVTIALFIAMALLETHGPGAVLHPIEPRDRPLPRCPRRR